VGMVLDSELTPEAMENLYSAIEEAAPYLCGGLDDDADLAFNMAMGACYLSFRSCHDEKRNFPVQVVA
jgi:hypothetical protein